MATVLPYLYLLVSVVLSASAQVGIKDYLNKLPIDAVSRKSIILSLFSSIESLMWLFLAGLGIIFWLLALREMPLHKGFSLTALSYVLVPALSAIFLGEKISLTFALGTLLICIGIVLCVKS